jgi:hypothetical protein
MHLLLSKKVFVIDSSVAFSHLHLGVAPFDGFNCVEYHSPDEHGYPTELILTI